MAYVSYCSRRLFSVRLKRSPSALLTEANAFHGMIAELKTIQQLRAVSTGNHSDEDGSSDLDYIHMGDYRLAEVDHNRTNYFVIRNSPPFGDMDRATRRKYGKILFGKMMLKITFGVGFMTWITYGIFFSGYNCVEEAFVVAEDPGYGYSMVQVNPKWKGAMENYYRKNGLPVPWEDNVQHF